MTGRRPPVFPRSRALLRQVRVPGARRWGSHPWAAGHLAAGSVLLDGPVAAGLHAPRLVTSAAASPKGGDGMQVGGLVEI